MSRDHSANDLKVIWPNAHKRERPLAVRWFGEMIGKTPKVYMFKPEFDRAMDYAWWEEKGLSEDVLLACRHQTPVYGLYDVTSLGVEWIEK